MKYRPGLKYNAIDADTMTGNFENYSNHITYKVPESLTSQKYWL